MFWPSQMATKATLPFSVPGKVAPTRVGGQVKVATTTMPASPRRDAPADNLMPTDNNSLWVMSTLRWAFSL